MFKWIFALFEKKPEKRQGCPYDECEIPIQYAPCTECLQAKRKEETHNWHGEDGFSSAYRGPGGPGCAD